uniref:Uncharacterized protein n=1 Tax=Helianthus annuus TaxID=4232 RepID=A0A251SLF3_HELAN
MSSCRLRRLHFMSGEWMPRARGNRHRGARLNRACWTFIGSFSCHSYPVYLCR